jgi:hypothetical protein
MAEPFAGDRDLSLHRARTTASTVKLDAAKDVLLAEIGRLEPQFPVVIFGFSDRATLLYEGEAGRHEDIEAALGLLKADSGTDIAAALDAAAAHKSARRQVSVPRILLISDGKSDRVEAKRAARRCVYELSIGIHFILIDPTEQGEAFVKEVVEPLGGTWDSVRRREELDTVARGATEKYQQDLARAEAWARQADQEAAQIAEEVQDRQAVEFTAGYPGRIRPNTEYSLLIFVHLAAMQAEVRKRLADLNASFEDIPRESQAEAIQRIPIGTLLEITPAIHNVSATPLRQTLAWMGELELATFRMWHKPVPGQSEPCAGFVNISVDRLVIASIPVSVAIDANKADLPLSQTSTEMIRRVFASYSRKDEAVVRACKVAYRGLGIQLFVDKDDILTGQQWRDVIRRRIADHQLFQLYWSKSAADSTEVANEWQMALEIAPQRAVDFIQPVYWSKPVTPPPARLARLHFGFLDVSAFHLAPEPETAAAAQASQPSAVGDLKARFPVFEVVQVEAADIDRLREDLGKIVPWLEDLLSVRYYPPATFLVDEHAVRTVKAVREPRGSDGAGQRDEIALRHSIDLLQCMALGFHVGNLIGEDMAFSERSSFFGATDPQAEADYNHVAVLAEYLFAGQVRSYALGQYPSFEGERESFEQVLQSVAGGSSGWDLTHMIEWLQTQTSASDRAEVERIVTQNDFEALRSFNTNVSVPVATRLMQTPLPQIAAKYRVERFFGLAYQTSLRFALSFPAYIRSYCERWLSFVDAAIQRRGNAILEVGYSAPEQALLWLEQQLPGVGLERNPTVRWQKSGETYYTLHLADYRSSVAFLSETLVRQLESGGEPVVRLVAAIVDTFGVFVPGSAAEAQTQIETSLAEAGWHRNAAIPGQDKILLCMRALERAIGDMKSAGSNPARADELAHRLSAAVLVHEHFHSALSHGLDRQGRVSQGSSRAREWEAAAPLNESLAAWTEHHYFRGDRDMVARIGAYIRSGEYPNWPYRGAELIEREYVDGGVPAVRAWVQHLRDDPENAQSEFNRRWNVFTASRARA